MGFHIIQLDIFNGTGEIAKENAFSDMIAELAVAFARGAYPNTATKCLESAKVGFGGVAMFKSGRSIVFAWEGVFDSEIGVKGVGPEFYIKIGIMEHSAESVANCLMSPFDRSVLMGTVSSSGTDIVAKACKEGTDFGVVVQLAALVKKDVLTSDAGGVAKEPVVKPGKRCPFGNAGNTGKLGGGMVSNEKVTGLSIEAFVSISLGRIL
jgi:hypothetical protein